MRLSLLLRKELDGCEVCAYIFAAAASGSAWGINLEAGLPAWIDDVLGLRPAPSQACACAATACTAPSGDVLEGRVDRARPAAVRARDAALRHALKAPVMRGGEGAALKVTSAAYEIQTLNSPGRLSVWSYGSGQGAKFASDRVRSFASRR